MSQAERVPLQSPGYAGEIITVGDSLYVLTSSLLRTNDLKSWETLFEVAQDRYLSDFAVSDDNKMVFLSTGYWSVPYDGQLIRHYLSEDAGQSFKELTIPGWHDDHYRKAISTPHFLWAIDRDSMLRISTNDRSLEVSPLPGTRPNDVFQYGSSVILNCVDTIWRTDDEGDSWYQMSSLTSEPVQKAMGAENHLFFEINDRWHYSIDFGLTWRSVMIGVKDDHIPYDHEIVLGAENMYLNSEVGIRIFDDSLSQFQFYLSKDTSFNALAVFKEHFVGSPAYMYADQEGWSRPMASMVQRSLSGGGWKTVENLDSDFCTNFVLSKDQIIKLDRDVTWFNGKSFEMDSILRYTDNTFNNPNYLSFGTGASYLEGNRILSILPGGVVVLDLEDLEVDTILMADLVERRAVRSGNALYFGSLYYDKYYRLNLENLQHQKINAFSEFPRCWSVYNDSIYSVQALRIVRKPFDEDATFEYWESLPSILVDTESRFYELRVNDDVIILVSSKGPYGNGEKFFYHLFDRRSDVWHSILVPRRVENRHLLGSMDLVSYKNFHFFNFPSQGVWSYNSDSKQFKEIKGYGPMFRTINLVLEEDALYLGTYRGLFKLDLNVLLSSEFGDMHPKTIELYPNPAGGRLQVKLSDNDHEVIVKIRALDGRNVLSAVLSRTGGSLDLPVSLSNGIYLVELYSGPKRVHTAKLVIQR